VTYTLDPRAIGLGQREGSGCVADLPTVEDAIALAAKAHRGQRCASPEAEPYVIHPLRGMLRFTEPVEQIAAVVHDAIEDTDLAIDDLVKAVGRRCAVLCELLADGLARGSAQEELHEHGAMT
jgi:(p)ppGpp synthase/HD superfamily hydrolase